jgi:ketosteroid isomerase-like protein
MDELEAFLNSTMPRLKAADIALHNGDAAPRGAIWSHNDPVTLFGAAFQGSGWAKLSATFGLLASRFSNCTSWEYEVIAAGASGDLAYIVGIEHTTASVGGAAAQAYSLRVSTILRLEGGEWKVVHRHADPAPDSTSASDQLARLSEKQRTET